MGGGSGGIWKGITMIEAQRNGLHLREDSGQRRPFFFWRRQGDDAVHNVMAKARMADKERISHFRGVSLFPSRNVVAFFWNVNRSSARAVDRAASCAARQGRRETKLTNDFCLAICSCRP